MRTMEEVVEYVFILVASNRLTSRELKSLLETVGISVVSVGIFNFGWKFLKCAK